MKSKIIFFFIFVLLVSSSSQAYELECNIDPIMYDYDAHTYVTTKSFELNITLSNIGNRSFPPTKVNVTIFNPKHEVTEPYYSFIYTIPYELVVRGENKSYSYTPLWRTGSEGISLFELIIPGTWEIRVDLIDHPIDEEVIIHISDTKRVGQCRKYFSVEELGVYEREKASDERSNSIEEEVRSLTSELKNLTISLNNLTIILIVIAILTLIFSIFPKFSEWINKNRRSILLVEGFIAGFSYILLYDKSLLTIFIVFGLLLSYYYFIFYKKEYTTFVSLLIPFIVNFCLFLLNIFLAYLSWKEILKFLNEINSDSIVFVTICLIGSVILSIIAFKSLFETEGL